MQKWDRSREGGNATAGTVLLRPNEKATEVAVLQQLKKLAPLALLPADKGGGLSRLPGSWGMDDALDYPAAARELLSSAGFVEPVGCREVFNFDAASLRDRTTAAAQVSTSRRAYLPCCFSGEYTDTC